LAANRNGGMLRLIASRHDDDDDDDDDDSVNLLLTIISIINLCSVPFTLVLIWLSGSV